MASQNFKRFGFTVSDEFVFIGEQGRRKDLFFWMVPPERARRDGFLGIEILVGGELFQMELLILTQQKQKILINKNCNKAESANQSGGMFSIIAPTSYAPKVLAAQGDSSTVSPS